MYDLLLKAWKLLKLSVKWAWDLDGDNMAEYVGGSLLMIIITICGLLTLFGLGSLLWAAFSVSWWWIFSWPPAISLALVIEIRVIKGIIAIYEDFFI